MTHALSGFNTINTLNLTGKSLINNTSSPNYQIIFLKNRIIANYIVPLFSKQWGILKQNVFLIDNMEKNICKFYKKYKLDELLVYSELLKVLKLLIEEHNLLEDLDSTIANKRDPNLIVNMVYNTTKIRLLPEYEIYNSILGKPNRKLNETYNTAIISDIIKLLDRDNISFAKIKDFIDTKYKN
jgi:hypothetical protein